ncbi:MAG: hypothetical protein NC184_05355 [Roseburia sp.]|nr:hypothetical protein [Roseburia sp.]
MKWNNRRERNKFITKQAKLRELYIEEGMTDEQIQAMYDFDLTEFNGHRREAEHTFRLDEIDMDSVTVELEPCYSSRYAWIAEIENEEVIVVLKRLSEEDIELLTKHIIEGCNLTEIAHLKNVTQQAISKRFQKIKKYFNLRL